MALEMPISVSIVSRLPNAAVNTAALLILSAVAIWIESPVIDLLATSTTLADDRQRWLTIRRFVGMLIVWVTLFHAAIVLTPIFGWVTETVMGVPHEVAQPCRLGLIIMIPWSGLIGWRRYLQGLMIRAGRTKPISVGTAIRVSTILSVGFGLYWSTSLSGILIVAIALICSVGNEALFMQWASRSTIRERYSLVSSSGDSLSLGRLARFHFPLTMSTMVTLTSMPIIGAALAHSPDAVIAMASWQVASSVLFLPRAITYALLEVVISLVDRPGAHRALREFCLKVGLVGSGFVLFAGVLGWDKFIFHEILGAKSNIAELAHIAFLAAALVPLTNAVMSNVRGLLTAAHLTIARLTAIGVSTGVLVGMLILGVALKWSGVVTAAVALTVSQFAELGTLWICWVRRAVMVVEPGVDAPALSEAPDLA